MSEVRSRSVAFVLPTLNSGGAERAALNLAANASRSRCVVVAEAAGGDLSGDPLASGALTLARRFPRAGRPARIYRLARALRSIRPDVVVSILSPLVTTAAARLAGVPVMHWVQAPWSRTTSAGREGLVPAVHRLVLRTVSQASRLVAVATPGLLQECRALGVPPSKLALLPNGIVLPPFPPRVSSRRGPARIVSVGRLEPQKRQDTLLEAVAPLCKERDLELVLVGSGSYERQLKEQARMLGIPESVTFTGFVTDPHRFIETADVFALATDHEGFGNVIVEALACGVPTVVSDVPYGPRFILGETQIGRLVEPGSASAFADALRVALERPPTEAERADARRRAEDFSIDRVAARFDDLVDHLLAAGVEPLAPGLTTWPHETRRYDAPVP